MATHLLHGVSKEKIQQMIEAHPCNLWVPGVCLDDLICVESFELHGMRSQRSLLCPLTLNLTLIGPNPRPFRALRRPKTAIRTARLTTLSSSG